MSFWSVLLERSQREGAAVLARWASSISAAPAKRWTGVLKSRSNPFINEARGGQKLVARCLGSHPPDRISFTFSTPYACPALPILSNPSNSFPKVSNLTPRSPKRAQLMAKIAQNTPKSLQPNPPRPQNVAKTLYRCSFLHFGHFSKDRSQDHQKCSKWLQDGHLGPNLEALGAILAPSWRHLAPFGRDFGRSSPAQIDQNQLRQLLKVFLSQGRPQELPDPLQTSILQVFKSMFQKFLTIFQNTFL